MTYEIDKSSRDKMAKRMQDCLFSTYLLHFRLLVLGISAENRDLIKVHTHNILTGPCLHQRYELKTNISACIHSDECLRSESGRSIRSDNL